MITVMIMAGLISLGFFILMFKLGLRKVLGYDLYVDVSLTILLSVLLSGSFDGIIVALLGGLIISIFLLVIRKFIGYERYESKLNPYGKMRTQWVRYPGWLG